MTLTPKQWVDTWRKAGEVLERIKAEELLTMDTREAIRQIMPMCDWCIEHSEPRTTSGLVEQQRWFAKMREKQQ
ncbi:MAG: hypothetical protein FWC50_14995 [Planctomycetaceae bacterium]|nr:hypothetical protein [Planctomycetaceae bacterium]